MMRIFTHPSLENLDNRNKSLFPRNLYAGGISRLAKCEKAEHTWRM